ncbi:MAG: valine--tRNA ligase [Candidatus Dormibacteria bacterium]
MSSTAGPGPAPAEATGMPKTYDPAALEAAWYRAWEERGYFRADAQSQKPRFTIMMPPPNVTGELHMGHALYSIQDALTRWKRMSGFEALWLPGTDHAAIATQNAIERQLAVEGTTKEAMGRDAFAARVSRWYREYGDAIVHQLRRLGASCDWSRLRFTMDDAYYRSVLTAFVRLYEEGLIYRGPRLVNWCPRCQSAISDLEVEFVERDDTLFYVRYPLEDGSGHLTVATVRPETMLADTAVAVHPQDERYGHLVGTYVTLPVVGRRLQVIGDAHVERAFGTGALKVTPGHDPMDYEIGIRHGLEVLSMLTPDGHVDFPTIPEVHGLTAAQGRAWMVARLREQGLLEREEPYRHSVDTCDRCGEVIEPMISEQWWCRMESLAAPAIRVVEEGRLRFHNPRYNDVYLNWMRNLRDWCVSRQLWLGHRIPVYSCADGHLTASVDPPARCSTCGASQLVQDPDVLDTWFSSALWPFATLGWPDATADLAAFYPGDVLSTAREIIFLWVSRMIMTGIHFMGTAPFDDVVIHAVVQSPDGQRMSKSKGTGVDPLVLIDRYGADATRFWCLAVAMNKQDVRFAEEKIENYRGLANKLWNATRLVLENLDAPATDPGKPADISDTWILQRLSEASAEVQAALDDFDFSHACDAIYEFAWHEFCDWYLEIAKTRVRDEQDQGAAWTALVVLDQLLRLMHPFMPFITEELWQRLPASLRSGETIMFAAWPAPRAPEAGAHATEHMNRLFDLVRSVRNARQLGGHAAGVRARLAPEGPHSLDPGALRFVGPLARADLVDSVAGGEPVALEESRWRVDFGSAGERAVRLRRELDQAQVELERIRGKLEDQNFVSRAPVAVVERERGRARDLADRVDNLRSALGT